MQLCGTQLPAGSGGRAGLESLPLHPRSESGAPARPPGPGSPFRCRAREQVRDQASAGHGTAAFCASGAAFSPAMSHLTSLGPQLQTVTQSGFFCFTGTSLGRDCLTLCAGAKSWTVGDLGCLSKWQST